MAKNRDDFTVRYTNKHLMEKLEIVHQQTLKTNGRVTSLEGKSIGVWVSNNPFRFTIFVLAFVAIVISDVRQPVIELLLKAFI